MARGSCVVARRDHLYRRDLQECREDDLREGRVSEGSGGPFQLEPRREHAACHRLPRRRENQRGGVENAHSRGRDAQQVQGQEPKVKRH